MLKTNPFFKDLRTSSALAFFLKRLSEKNFFAAISRISDIPKQLFHYHTKVNLSFLVVIIETMSDFQTFSNISQINNLNFYRVFIVFTKDLDVCQNPPGNPFNLVFYTRSLIKCHKSPILREWYSLHPNKTIVNDFFIWKSNISELTQLKSLNLYERRKYLDGITLRISTLKVHNFEFYINLH